MGRLVLAVDPGQRIDPTAIVLTEELWPEAVPPRWQIPPKREIDGRDLVLVQPRRPPTVFVARHIERLHGEPYAVVARRVAEIAAKARDIGRGAPLVIAVDSTGLGRPVAETIADELRLARVRCWLSSVVFTYGERLTGVLGDPELRLGKAFMVSSLVALFEARRVKLPAHHPEAEAMLRELLDYQIKVSRDGIDKYEGRIGAHDDLVTALGLACLGEWRRPTVIRGH